MQVVLGIDAAWTLTQPSGVALVGNQNGNWELLCVAASYLHFLAQADRALIAEKHPVGSRPDATTLLDAASILASRPVDLVAVDMPLARSRIVGRRVSDNAVSSAYGGRKCGTHSPSDVRPGAISDFLREGFQCAGYPLRTSKVVTPGLVEVYPHPALVELTGASERLPYKIAKIRKYWPLLSAAERRTRLYDQWTVIVTALDIEIRGVAAAFPIPEAQASSTGLKTYEDMLDAVVCAWVGICALEGRAVPFGDEDSAIWIPLSDR
jgi:predicted RNase H-like nuclease